MKKVVLFLLVLLAANKLASAQATDSSAVVDLYMDLNVAMLEGNSYNAERISERIMPDTALLPRKARINFYNIMGRLYENIQPADSKKYYSRVVAGMPDYYVAYRALGYLYLKDCEAAEQRMSEYPTDAGLRDKYMKSVKAALPYLEKAQACDPTPETLDIIVGLYKKINDDAGLKTLYKRMAAQSKSCVDILESM